MLISKEILKSREDWRVYYILDYLRENAFSLMYNMSDEELLDILYFVYQKNKDENEQNIYKFLVALECILIEENFQDQITLDLLCGLNIYQKIRELEEEEEGNEYDS